MCPLHLFRPFFLLHRRFLVFFLTAFTDRFFAANDEFDGIRVNVLVRCMSRCRGGTGDLDYLYEMGLLVAMLHCKHATRQTAALVGVQT